MYKLNEMSLKWNKIRLELVSHIYEMKKHLAKIFYYRDFTDYLRGWKTTCRKGFEEIPLCKHNNKFPTYDKLYQTLWVEREDTFDRTHETIIDDLNYDKDYDDLPDILAINPRFEFFCKEYIKALCLYASTKGGISSRENSELIDNLLKHYPM